MENPPWNETWGLSWLIADRKSHAQECLPAIWIAMDNLELFKALLDRGADPNANAIISRGMAFPAVKFTPLAMAVMLKNENMLQLLLEHSADINECQTTRYGTEQTGLMIAARRGYAEGVRLLLSKGARVNLKDKQGKTALDIALHEMHRVAYTGFNDPPSKADKLLVIPSPQGSRGQGVGGLTTTSTADQPT